MMNRRQFLQYTVALAVAAPLAHLGPFPTAVSAVAPQPAAPAQWIPTEDEVHEWLQYYKMTLQVGHTKFADAVGGLFNAQGGAVPHGKDEIPHDPALFLEAERAFNALERDRGNVAWSQGAGYTQGRDDLPRYNSRFTAPSNEGFAWYNGWLVGNNDRYRRITRA
jgi:hypothetical protein